MERKYRKEEGGGGEGGKISAYNSPITLLILI